MAQYGLLFSLCDGAPRSARELALAADLSPATVTEMLDGLAAAGLVHAPALSKTSASCSPR